MHYSQKNEQEVIEQAVEGMTGRFLDIGAYDGWNYSNTMGLVDRGWTGVMVEAGLDAFKKLLEKHGGSTKVVSIHAAIGPVDELKQFWNDHSTFSTTEQGNYRKFVHQGGFSAKYFVPILSVRTLLDYLKPMLPFAVVSIDTEGTSTDIFQELVKVIHPMVICVEHDQRQEAWEIGKAAGYQVLMQNEENIVFGR